MGEEVASHGVIHAKQLKTAVVGDEFGALLRKLLGESGIMDADFLAFGGGREVWLGAGGGREFLGSPQKAKNPQEKQYKPGNDNTPAGTIFLALHSRGEGKERWRVCRIYSLIGDW